MEKIEINNLTKKYGNVEALSNVSFSVFNGEHILLVGKTGAGLTTLLDIISGVSDYLGSVKIDGVERTEVDNKNLLISYVTYPSTFLRGSVKKNINYIAKLVNKNLTKEECVDLAEKYHLSLKSNVKKLSEIEKIFLNLLRIEIKNSEIVLIDFDKLFENIPTTSESFCEIVAWLNNFSGTLIVAENGQNLAPFYKGKILNFNFGVKNDNFSIENELLFPSNIFAFSLAKKLKGEMVQVKNFTLQKLMGGYSVTSNYDYNLTQKDFDKIYEKVMPPKKNSEIIVEFIDDYYFDALSGRFLCKISKENNL